ncbi:MAG TPA: hypothetical protein PLA16_00905 [Chitinophagales bacterium]|jgi:hypothetical protein|nr:hypothetical protein [Chitinophagales bacterium]HPW86556.1 hypothetical protein [Chitinophagales bacterium]HQO88611.1 hypothetical protein [Chitinophagales bacterium]
MKFKYLLPLLGWLIPTVIISLILFKYDAPLTSTQYMGFTALLVSACITYWTGVSLVLKDKK